MTQLHIFYHWLFHWLINGRERILPVLSSVMILSSPGMVFLNAGAGQPLQAGEIGLRFADTDSALCQYEPGWIDATLIVSLPDGATSRLQANWQVLEPAEHRTEKTYISGGQVKNGDTFTFQAYWPGISPGDEIVEIHLGGALLDITSGNPITSTGLDYYWYDWVCQAGPTQTATVPPSQTPPPTFTVTPTNQPSLTPTRTRPAPSATPVRPSRTPAPATATRVPATRTAIPPSATPASPSPTAALPTATVLQPGITPTASQPAPTPTVLTAIGVPVTSGPDQLLPVLFPVTGGDLSARRTPFDIALMVLGVACIGLALIQHFFQTKR